jgi:23S rRNA pseudouridine2605 synthase
VTVNGKIASLGDSADPARDVVAVDGVALAAEARAYWVLHKPRGVLTTLDDPQGRATVIELLPANTPRLYPIGRLDLDTAGLLLLTNDGDFAHRLLHPSFGVEREYRVVARGRVGPDAQRRLAAGVPLDDGVTSPARVERVAFEPGPNVTRLTLTLKEGRKRQIRRSLSALGHRVVELTRVRMGTQRLAELAPGESRPLTEGELRALFELVGRG